MKRKFNCDAINDDVDVDINSNEPKRKKHEWIELITLETNERVMEWINQHDLKYLGTTKASFGDTDWYRCGLLKRDHHTDCPVKAKIVRYNDKTGFVVSYTTWIHEHPDKKALKMPTKYRYPNSEHLT